jgi:YegS/Rv2252/BmrU family lipid kinase
MLKTQIVFIVNPRAGIGKYKKLERLLPEVLDLERFAYRLFVTQYRGHATLLAQQAVENHVDIVVAVGGDGTVNEIADVLVATNVCLGFIPTGSGNGLARHLHIPVRIKKAIRLINNPNHQIIDTLSVNGKICTSIAGMGFDAQIAELFARSKYRGFFPYLHYIICSFFQYQPKTYLIQQDGLPSVEHSNILMVSVANSSQWGFNIKVVSRASLQDGYADVCMIEKPTFFFIGFRVLALLAGKLHLDKSAVHVYHVKECTVVEKNGDLQPCHIDGEPVQRCNSMLVKVQEKSLRVLTPQRRAEVKWQKRRCSI